MDKFNFYDMVIYAARDSHSARTIANTVGTRRWREGLFNRYSKRRPYFRGNDSPLIVNWGSTLRPTWLEDRRFKITPVYLNEFEKVATAIDKLKFFRAISDYNSRNNKANRIPILKWSTDRSEVLGWSNSDTGVVIRKTLTGKSGKGIILVKEKMGSPEGLPEAPLYTRYYPKTHEFRVHVFRNPSGSATLRKEGMSHSVIDFTEKKYSGDLADRDQKSTVRSLENGWIHAHGTTPLTPLSHLAIQKASIATLEALGLDFGAVDILAILEPEKDGYRSVKSFKVCEVNTAPGLENTKTIEAYSKAIIEFYKESK